MNSLQADLKPKYGSLVVARTIGQFVVVSPGIHAGITFLFEAIEDDRIKIRVKRSGFQDHVFCGPVGAYFEVWILGKYVRLTVTRFGAKCRLAITAPNEWSIVRGELIGEGLPLLMEP